MDQNAFYKKNFEQNYVQDVIRNQQIDKRKTKRWR